MTEHLDPTPRHNGSHHPSGEWETMFQLVRDTRTDVRENRKETAGIRSDLSLMSTQVAVLLNDNVIHKRSAAETDSDVRSLDQRVKRLERAPVSKDRKANTGMVSGIAGVAIGIVLAVKEVIAYFGGAH